ncbi:DUF3040 domain-containing protein [Streptomyces corynorhini]|uniref:DUF3040 domain-containing protein n=1 Tax=Streptomyces corynorhini TaxID=2282652 RepID=A0A370B7X9_9ACTN|nr:DUF3040 domain-containing protein [Streptomyces corynorhini]RDG36234.1 DUF3040 domain-containing protein [Streptomyces corynorhini]
MATNEDQRLGDLAERLRRDDPRLAHALRTGTPCSPREYRHGTAWTMLAVALGGLALGIVIGHGLLIAAGLVLAGAAAHLFDPDRDLVRRGIAPPHEES